MSKPCSNVLLEDTRKPGTQPVRWGTEPAAKGARTDLSSAIALIQAHNTWAEVLNDRALESVCRKYLSWAREVFNARPIDNAARALEELYDWEKDVLTLLEGDPQHRTILWIWSSASGTGKTCFMQHVATRLSVLPASWRLADWLYAYSSEQVLWFNIPRDEADEKMISIMAATLEKASDHGLCLSGKYQSARKILKSWVVVTANIPPWISRLPKRIVEWCLDTTPWTKEDHRVQRALPRVVEHIV